jgi:hypothetical protein
MLASRRLVMDYFDFQASCHYDSETIIIIELKSNTKRNLVNTEYFACAEGTMVFGMCNSVRLCDRRSFVVCLTVGGSHMFYFN